MTRSAFETDTLTLPRGHTLGHRAKLAIAALAFFLPAAAIAGGWERTKNIADDLIYDEVDHTFYCGCFYHSHEDSDGSGDIIDAADCGYTGPETHAHRAGQVEWEHIVPASLMSARQLECWAGQGGSRQHCEDTDPRAQAMLFDLHNLAPSIGQVNALRSNDRYADLPDETSDFGGCQIEDTSGLFEPPACHKGDVARVWLYMHLMYGVEIAPSELAMFVQWSAQDPVSPWESEREKRIADHSRVVNPFVHGATPDPAGACPWEPG